MTAPGTEPALPAPFRTAPYRIRPEWIDANGHLNLAYYVLLFDLANDELWEQIGLGQALRAQRFSTFAAETHIFYRAEILETDTVTIASHLLASDAKRLHLTHEMRRGRDGIVSAQQEILYLCVDLDTRRVAPWPPATADGLQAAVASHQCLPRPDWIGRRIAMPTPAAPSPTASTPQVPA